MEQQQQQFVLEVEYREERKKNKVKKLRKNGFVPGIFYTKDENIPVKVKYSSLERIYRKVHKSKLIELKIKINGKEETKYAFIWDIQRDPVKSTMIHVDFLGVDLSKEIEVEVPIKVVGTAKGTEKGGVLVVYKESVIIKALPLSVPEYIEVDVSDLEINDKIHLNELKLPENVSLSSEEEEELPVVGVEPPEISEEEGEEETAEEGTGEGST